MAASASILCHRTVQAQDEKAPATADRAEAAPSPSLPAPGAVPADKTADSQEVAPAATNKLMVTVGKSLIIDSPLNIQRVHVANGDLAEAVAVNPKEVLINGKLPGETSLIVWQQNGARLVYDLTVRMSTLKLDAVRQQLAREFPSDDINVTYENDTAFVRGRVKDVTSADRVMAIASTLGKAVNLLRVDIPQVEPQVLLKVRFANVDRSADLQLGFNLYTGAFNQQTSLGTTQPGLRQTDAPDRLGIKPGTNLIPTLPGANILIVRPDINLVAELQALAAKNVLEFLAEPDVLAISGEPASFLAGGEFPFPMVTPGAGGTIAVTIQWREYGVRLNFLPNATPRGTIRLKVQPEVSSLDYGNAVTIAGYVIPALISRRVQTEVELESGQSFVIAGLLDNQTRDSFSKVPGIGDIPVLGKLFQTKNVTRNNSELLVIITPELVRPLPAGQKGPELTYPSKFLPPNSPGPFEHPNMTQTGPVPVKPPVDSLPYEQIMTPKKENPAQANPTYQLVPMAPAPAVPAAVPAGAAPAKGGSAELGGSGQGQKSN
jgi:pilus assembly protein CpaC